MKYECWGARKRIRTQNEAWSLMIWQILNDAKGLMRHHPNEVGAMASIFLKAWFSRSVWNDCTVSFHKKYRLIEFKGFYWKNPCIYKIFKNVHHLSKWTIWTLQVHPQSEIGLNSAPSSAPTKLLFSGSNIRAVRTYRRPNFNIYNFTTCDPDLFLPDFRPNLTLSCTRPSNKLLAEVFAAETYENTLISRN